MYPFFAQPTKAVRSLVRVSTFYRSILLSGGEKGCAVCWKNTEASMMALCAEYRYRGTLIAV